MGRNYHTAAKGGAARNPLRELMTAAFRPRSSGARSLPAARRSFSTEEPKDYGGTFLGKRPSATKKQTYISAALFTKITEIMAVIASDVTLPTFLDNVLEHHLATYRDEINELYESKTKRPL
jgi:hypothetical protein